MSLPPCVLAIDPGKTTGLACWSTTIPGGRYQFSCMELGFLEAGNAIDSIAGWWKNSCWVLWEQFSVRPKTPPADAHHAIEMIGVARRAAMVYGCRILTPATQEQRKVASLEMLRAIGWWRPGEDDAQSAAQHLYAWMMRTGNEPSDLAVRVRS